MSHVWDIWVSAHQSHKDSAASVGEGAGDGDGPSGWLGGTALAGG